MKYLHPIRYRKKGDDLEYRVQLNAELWLYQQACRSAQIIFMQSKKLMLHKLHHQVTHLQSKSWQVWSDDIYRRLQLSDPTLNYLPNESIHISKRKEKDLNFENIYQAQHGQHFQ